MPRPDAAQKIRDAAPSAGASKRTVAVVVAVLAVAAVVAAIFIGKAVSGGSTASPAAGGGTSQAVPKGALGFGQGMVVTPNAPAGAPVLDIYEDPQCPICKQFEEIFGPAIDQIVAANEAKVIVHTMTFLDTNLKNDSSKRAANAAMCAADQGKFLPYVEATYAGQPATEGAGYTDAELVGFATKAGVTDMNTWKACLASNTYLEHVKALETDSEKAGVNGTPTVKLNGEVVSLNGLDAASFRAKVKAATK